VSIDRRALILGSWLARGRDKPAPLRVKSILRRWEKVLSDKRYRFRSITNKRANPKSVANPHASALMRILEQATDITTDTELLLYFLGHSNPSGENDLQLILGLNADKGDRVCTLSWLLSTIREAGRFRRLILILDTCHAGRARQILSFPDWKYYAMFATGDAYAFDAQFSEGILRALETPLRKSDQRIDRRAGGVTYEKIFESALNFVLTSAQPDTKEQKPNAFGDYKSELLVKAPVVVPDGFNPYATSRTIYGRVYRLIHLLTRKTSLTVSQLHQEINKDPAFLVRRDGDESEFFVSRQRLEDYLSFLRQIRWVIQPAGKYQLTDEGRKACNLRQFNKQLLDAIEQQVFGDTFTLDVLDDIVTQLLGDMIPPTPAKIKERFGMKGNRISLTPATRVALQVLPSTGRFLHGSADAIFPSERGGTQSRTQALSSLV
jgi:hypothetical protein